MVVVHGILKNLDKQIEFVINNLRLKLYRKFDLNKTDILHKIYLLVFITLLRYYMSHLCDSLFAYPLGRNISQPYIYITVSPSLL